jgi:hypothetical protein
MKGELAVSVESPDSKTTPETSPARARKSKRRPAQASTGGASVRFFLSKSDGNGIPNLDREFDTEPEATVESFKTGKNYFVISEWKGLADLSKKIPLIRKEVVTNKRQI